KEIDYDGSKDTTYTGKGGIKLNLFNRLLFALRNQDFNMLVSGYVSSDSKLLINRNIITRAQKAVPFLTVDQDPYMLLTSDGRLKWILDAYTTSDYYPYSQDASEYGSFNYIRNSVKIVIDAYDGSVSYYIIDKNDPIVEMYNKAYPGLFSKDPLPADIASHLRYPELLFKIQSEMLRRYHLDPNVAENPQKFYDNQDKWDIPQLQAGGQDSQTQNMDPYYNMVKMPGGVSDKEELVLMRPFTPSNKNNMTSWLSVRSNTLSNYGQLVLFSFSNNTNIYGPNQVQSKINQIEQISSDMTLWGQRGSSAYMGNLLVIPVEDTVLYVEPVYVRAEGASSIPEVKEIVVGYQDGEEFRYGIGTNLNDAISKMFPASIPAQPNPNTSQTQTQTQTPQTQTTQPDTSKQGDQKLYNDIRSKYDEMKKQLDELGKLIDQMKQ
ncbi:MAG: UPF0182 family protein, partial [Bacillota bacterium]|nr:UPF0182 family protein [Bacillota bacterium]